MFTSWCSRRPASLPSPGASTHPMHGLPRDQPLVFCHPCRFSRDTPASQQRPPRGCHRQRSRGRRWMAGVQGGPALLWLPLLRPGPLPRAGLRRNHGAGGWLGFLVTVEWQGREAEAAWLASQRARARGAPKCAGAARRNPLSLSSVPVRVTGPKRAQNFPGP